ncbi:MAG: hypothetical protein ACT4QC_10105 [Planctomycetaceae bacterium]
MNFLARPPSTNWEYISLPGEPSRCAWVWFKPANAPHCVIVQVTPEFFTSAPGRPPITLRSLAHHLGLDAGAVTGWTLYGVPDDGRQGANPAWDNPLPQPRAGAEAQIVLFTAPAGAIREQQPIAASPAAATSFGRMETSWNACLQLELQLAAAAKQLNSMLVRITSLNRDLSTEERRFGDQQDKRDWEETRRWLRDITARLSRSLKDHHLGATSAAGKRNWHESVYKQYVVARIPFEGQQQAEREYEAYRKTMQTLLANINNALGVASQDGERRAQLILTRIAAKVRMSRSSKK